MGAHDRGIGEDGGELGQPLDVLRRLGGNLSTAEEDAYVATWDTDALVPFAG